MPGDDGARRYLITVKSGRGKHDSISHHHVALCCLRRADAFS